MSKEGSKTCNRCKNTIETWNPPAYDEVNKLPVCSACKVLFFYDVSLGKWFFSREYGFYDKQRLYCEANKIDYPIGKDYGNKN